MDESGVASMMMKKMGWSQGRGLGKNEDGNVKPIRVSKKNDKKGMGFKGNDMDWVAHQNDFEGLLSSLQDYHSEKEHVKSKDKTKKSLNLMEKSKKSRSRVHFHKAIKGKDLSNAKEDDLNSILGIKKPKISKVLNKVEVPTPDTNLKSSTTNMKDYFSEKIKRKKKQAEKSNLETDIGTSMSMQIETTNSDCSKEKNPVESTPPVNIPTLDINSPFFKQVNYLNIASHNLRNNKYRSLAKIMPECCEALRNIHENNHFPGSNILLIKGYGN